jgi:CheY-like chemotaxis protein
MRILVVEDDTASRKLLFRHLHVLGFHGQLFSIQEHIRALASASASSSSSTQNTAYVPLPTFDFAVNGLDGVDSMKSKHYDVVFMDLQMPKCSGIQASQTITQWYELDEVHQLRPIKPYIIALTGNAFHEFKEASAQAGITVFATKPYSSSGISKMLQEAAFRLYDIWNKLNR